MKKLKWKLDSMLNNIFFPGIIGLKLENNGYTFWEVRNRIIGKNFEHNSLMPTSTSRAYGAPNVTKIKARCYRLYLVILRHRLRNITLSVLRRRQIVTPSYSEI